jgi:hypothetical protein
MLKRLLFQTIIFILFLSGTNLYGQKEKFNLNFYDFSPPQGAVLKAYPDYQNFSYKDYLNFLDSLRYSDQYYRIMSIKQGNQNANSLTNVSKINDHFNAKILLMLLKKFGWPCSNDLNKSMIAFLVVWHQRSEPKIYLDFEPYVKIANQKKCIQEDFFKQLNHLFKTGEVKYF